MAASRIDFSSQEYGLGYTLFRNLILGDFPFNDDGQR